MQAIKDQRIENSFLRIPFTPSLVGLTCASQKRFPNLAVESDAMIEGRPGTNQQITWEIGLLLHQ